MFKPQRTILSLICLMFLLVSAIAAQENSSSALFVVNVDGKKGFIDQTGKVLIAPEFNEVEDFSEGLAAVKINERWGYIDTKGALAIEPKFGAGLAFSEGVAVNLLNDSFDRERNEWILLDRSGKYIELPQIKDLDSKFSEGLIAAKNGQEKWGYLDKTGEVVIPYKFERAAAFSDGLAHVLLDGKFGYIDRQGNFVITPRFTEVKLFKEGVAAVKIGGQLILGEGIEAVDEKEKEARWYVIDKTGKYLAKLPDNAVGAAVFSEGLAWVQLKDKKDGGIYRFGFINKSGKFAISPIYPDANNFSDGLARVYLTGNVANPSFINRNGKIIYSTKDATVGDFRNGLARIQEGYSGTESFDDEKKQGYINTKGQFIWQPTK